MGVTAAAATPDAPLSQRSLEALEYSKDFGVSLEQAENALAIQAKGNEADIAGQMENRLDTAFAGIWFDNQTQEFVVPVLGPQSAWLAEGELRATGIRSGEFRLASADRSWNELEAAQERLNRTLSRQRVDGHVLTSIDPRTNAVVIEVAKEAGPVVAAEVRHARIQVGGSSETRQGVSRNLAPRPAACQGFNCDPPYRAGVGIAKRGSEFSEADCTGAFKATGIGTGNRYVLSAGHCAVNTLGTKWEAYNSNRKALELGVTERAYWGTSGYDLVKIDATGSEWDAASWPALVTEWDPKTLTITNPAKPITSEAHSYIGQYACHTGITTGTSCGYVGEMGVGYEIKYPERQVIVRNLVALNGVCIRSGDSGGPVFAGSVALGITSAEDGELAGKECENTDFYTQVTEAADVFGVTVAPRPASWHYDNTPGGTLTSKPAIASSESDLLDLFARGTNNALWYRHWNGGG
ncbi:MAG TPA: trypsin-like serine protease, partial [Solirubrobacterales bacterium]|nr:trypsin-like serine protease [Solirubrobacterales bacterium]